MDSRHNNRQRAGKRSQQAKRSELNRHKPSETRREEQTGPIPQEIPKEPAQNLQEPTPQQTKDIFVDIDPLMNSENQSSVVIVDEQKAQQVGPVATNIDMDQIISNPIQTSTSQPLEAQADDQNNDSNSLDLISSLTKLNTPSGSEVYLVGTAHFSHKSVQDVQEIIKKIQPNAVVLELCEERSFMLQLDEESLLEQNRKLSFDKVRSAILEKGLAQGLIYIMFVKMSANLTEKLGMAPGSEFRAASNMAVTIPGCGIVLGDRSLKVTIARAVASLSLWQKIKLVYQVVLSDVSITQEDVEKCKDKDILEQMLQELGGEFPGFKRVLLDERNVYLAHSIYNWSETSVTSEGPAKVVAVVGCGHVKGIIENWGTTTDEDCRKLIEIPKRSRTSKVITKTIKYCSLALLLYVGYRVVVPTSVQTAIYDRILG